LLHLHSMVVDKVGEPAGKTTQTDTSSNAQSRQVAGAAKRKARARSPSPKTAYPSAFSQRRPLSRMNQTFGPDRTDPSNAIFMPRKGGRSAYCRLRPFAVAAHLWALPLLHGQARDRRRQEEFRLIASSPHRLIARDEQPRQSGSRGQEAERPPFRQIRGRRDSGSHRSTSISARSFAISLVGDTYG